MHRDLFLLNKNIKSYYNVNNELCIEFAEYIINLMGGEADVLYG